MAKITKIFSIFNIEEKLDQLRLSPGLLRLVKVLLLQVYLIHFMTCIWYFITTLCDNQYNTWVGSRGIVDSDSFDKYAQSFYWAF